MLPEALPSRQPQVRWQCKGPCHLRPSAGHTCSSPSALISHPTMLAEALSSWHHTSASPLPILLPSQGLIRSKCPISQPAFWFQFLKNSTCHNGSQGWQNIQRNTVLRSSLPLPPSTEITLFALIFLVVDSWSTSRLGHPPLVFQEMSGEGWMYRK